MEPLGLILFIISPFAAAIPFIFLKFLIWAKLMFVITPISGLTIFDKKSISPFYPYQLQSHQTYLFDLYLISLKELHICY